MAPELANNLLTFVILAFVVWKVGAFVRDEHLWRRATKQSQAEWDSIQQQIRAARTAEEREAAVDRFVERLKRPL